MSEVKRYNGIEEDPEGVYVLHEDFERERQRRVEAEEALETISHGAGTFDRDPFQHARNCIEDMKALARAHLARYKEGT